MELSAGQTQAGAEVSNRSRRLPACPRLDPQRDLDKRDLATLDGARIEESDPARETRRWRVRYWSRRKHAAAAEHTVCAGLKFFGPYVQI